MFFLAVFPLQQEKGIVKTGPVWPAEPEIVNISLHGESWLTCGVEKLEGLSPDIFDRVHAEYLILTVSRPFSGLPNLNTRESLCLWPVGERALHWRLKAHSEKNRLCSLERPTGSFCHKEEGRG